MVRRRQRKGTSKQAVLCMCNTVSRYYIADRLAALLMYALLAWLAFHLFMAVAQVAPSAMRLVPDGVYVGTS